MIRPEISSKSDLTNEEFQLREAYLDKFVIRLDNAFFDLRSFCELCST